MSILLLVLSLVFLMFLCMRGVPIFVAAFLAGVFLLLTAGMNPIDPFITSYSEGLGGYFGKFFFIFILGEIFGKLTDTSGAADSIAKAIIDRLGDKFIIPSIIVACAILGYGGVSVFVALFTVYPMMVSLFRKADLPRRLLPVTYFSGGGTFVCMMPDSPQIQNLIPMKFLNTPADAAFVPGIITAGVEAALVFAFMIWLVKRVRANGEHFVASEKGTALLASLDKNRKMPHWGVALLPMIVLLIALNAFKLEAGLAIFVGIIAALGCYADTLNWKHIWRNLGGGTMGGVTMLTLCGLSRKDGYGPVGVVTVLIPLICLVMLIALPSIL